MTASLAGDVALSAGGSRGVGLAIAHTLIGESMKVGVFAFPGLAITLTVMGANFFGDALRDVLDPRQRL